MFMIYLHTKFHMSSSDGKLVTTIEWRTKYTFCAATTLLYILQIQKTNKICTFFYALPPQKISGSYFKWH